MPASAPTFTPDAVATGLAWLAAVLYLLGLVTLVVRRRRDRASASRFDLLPGLLGFLAHLGSLVVRGAALGRFPVANLQESSVFLAALLALAYLVAAARFRYPAVEVLLVALVVGFLAVSFLVPEDVAAASTPSLKSRWFVFHILLSFLGITALFAACVLSILYLLADVQLKNKRPGLLLRFLPSLVACDRSALRLLGLGFPLLTLGIVTGWFWAREAGGLEWGPKEMLAVLAWGIYGALLYVRVARGWSGRKAAILGLTGGLAALGAFFGIRV